MTRVPKNIQVELDLKLIKINGTWEPNDVERRAAWELYVELITRVAVVPMQQGLLREALNSLHSLFANSREILRRYGPATADPKPNGQYNLAYLTVAMLNFVLRPVLSYWHPQLESFEATKIASVSRFDHESQWAHASRMRDALAVTQQQLAAYSALLATACGIPDLTAAIPKTQHGTSQ